MAGEEAIVMKKILRFDPQSASPLVREIFENRTARTLWMLWKSGHIVCDGFDATVLKIAKKIDANNATTAAELAACFPHNDGYGTFVAGDVQRFCEEYRRFFVGEEEIAYEIVRPSCARREA